MAWWWSWLLAIVGASGLFLAGSGRRLGWGIGIGVQVLWITYACVTGQWGFIASALLFAGVNIRNWVRWTREQTTADRKQT